MAQPKRTLEQCHKRRTAEQTPAFSLVTITETVYLLIKLSAGQNLIVAAPHVGVSEMLKLTPATAALKFYVRFLCWNYYHRGAQKWTRFLLNYLKVITSRFENVMKWCSWIKVLFLFRQIVNNQCKKNVQKRFRYTAKHRLCKQRKSTTDLNVEHLHFSTVCRRRMHCKMYIHLTYVRLSQCCVCKYRTVGVARENGASISFYFGQQRCWLSVIRSFDEIRSIYFLCSEMNRIRNGES